MNSDLISEEHIIMDSDASNKIEVLTAIANLAKKLNYISQPQLLIDAFLKREEESSTGFEDGFAIPHARITDIKSAAVLVLKTKNPIEYNSMDGKPTNFFIALIVPASKAGEQHLTILSDIAVKLMDEKVKDALQKAKTPKDVLNVLSSESLPNQDKVSANFNQNQSSSTGKNVIAITACITGVAHTYMAEEKLLKTGKELGYNIRVETHGSKGIGTPFTQQEINNADVVIFAVDTNVDKSRFGGKKVYEVKVAKAIKDPEGVIEDAYSQGVVYSTGVSSSGSVTNEFTERTSVMKHILAGISYMIPVIVLGGICLAFSLGIAKAIWGPSATTSGKVIGQDPTGTYSYVQDPDTLTWSYKENTDPIYSDPNGPLHILEIIGGAAFSMMIPILGGFIANSIAGRAAIAPAMVASFIGNDASKFANYIPGLSEISTPMGFIGALLAGLLSGYLVKWINTWKVPRSLAAAMPIFFIPLMVGLVISLLFIYVIGAPVGWVMSKVSDGISSAYGYNKSTGAVNTNIGLGTGLAIGILLGAMGGFDMGGPVNKIAFVTCSFLITQSQTVGLDSEAVKILQRPMGSLAAAIPVAPLGMGFTTIFFPRFFDKDTKNLGVAAIIMGSIGISEGAIPFAIRDPKRAILANVVGSALAGGIAGALGAQDAAAHGGPIVAVLGAVPYGVQTLYFFIAIIAGVVATTSIYGFWLLADAGRIGSVKERHVAYLTSLDDLKREAKEEYRDTIHQAKKTVSVAKSSKGDVQKAQNELNQTIQAAKNKLNQKISEIIKKREVAKTAFGSTKLEESQQWNVAKKDYKLFVSAEQQKTREAIQKLKTSNVNKSELSDDILDKKQNLKTVITNDEIRIRKPFVDKYNSLLLK